MPELPAVRCPASHLHMSQVVARCSLSHASSQVNAVRELGGEVRLVGESYTETQAYAWEVAEQEGRTFIAPYDDPLTIAGVPPTPAMSG